MFSGQLFPELGRMGYSEKGNGKRYFFLLTVIPFICRNFVFSG